MQLRDKRSRLIATPSYHSHVEADDCGHTLTPPRQICRVWCRAMPRLVARSVLRGSALTVPSISQSQFIHSSELRDNHLPTIHQPRLNHTPKDSFGGGRKLLLMEPRRIRRIHSPRSSLHRLTAAASTTRCRRYKTLFHRLTAAASTTRCRRYKTLSDFIPTTTTLCKRSGDRGGEGRALRGRMRPRDWRRWNGSHAGRRLMRRAFAKAGRCA